MSPESHGITRRLASVLPAFAFVAGMLKAGSAAALTAVPVDLLPSWNEGASKTAILTFVDRVTRQGSPDFVESSRRVAVFDNDGTLWPEHPMYIQLAFALDRVKAMAPLHPEWTRRGFSCRHRARP